MADEEAKKKQREEVEERNQWLRQENQRIARNISASQARVEQLERTSHMLGIEYASIVASPAYNHANFYTSANRPPAPPQLSRTESTGSNTMSWPPEQQGRGQSSRPPGGR